MKKGNGGMQMNHPPAGKCVLLGRSARQVVERFPAIFPDAKRFYFISYVPQPGVKQQMGSGGGSADLTVEALVAAHKAGIDVAARMLKGIEVDESSAGCEVAALEMTSQLEKLRADCSTHGEALALYSHCRDESGSELHIPMMDFRIQSGNDVREHELLRLALRRLGQRRGVLLNSGNSYPYYGFELLSPAQWKRFMAAGLLLAPLVDARYIAHRMLAGKACLRLNEVSGKEEPKVVACLDEGCLASCSVVDEMKA
jgi:hypothetical protein